MIKRQGYNEIINRLHEEKIVVLYGPRQAGKTTLTKEIAKQFTNVLHVQGDIPRQSERLSSKDDLLYTQKLTNIDLLIIDEAQYIKDIGLLLKILYDLFRGKLHIIATGSSSFDLAQKTQEPLTGRKITYTLLPFGVHELKNNELSYNQRDIEKEGMLLYGLYPDIYLEKNRNKKREKMNELLDAYLFKDILQFEGIKKSETLIRLVKLLAYQIGKPISTQELATQLHISHQTVDTYLNILEQAFIIYSVHSYSKNLRKELSKGKKVYFWDLGIRNGIIDNFSDIATRPDRGEIRENFVFSEFKKKRIHEKQAGTLYFWRTYDQQEIDIIEKKDDSLTAFEVKWSPIKAKIPQIFCTTYPTAKTNIITPENFLTFL